MNRNDNDKEQFFHLVIPPLTKHCYKWEVSVKVGSGEESVPESGTHPYF